MLLTLPTLHILENSVWLLLFYRTQHLNITVQSENTFVFKSMFLKLMTTTAHFHLFLSFCSASSVQHFIKTKFKNILNIITVMHLANHLHVSATPVINLNFVLMFLSYIHVNILCIAIMIKTLIIIVILPFFALIFYRSQNTLLNVNFVPNNNCIISCVSKCL